MQVSGGGKGKSADDGLAHAAAEDDEHARRREFERPLEVARGAGLERLGDPALLARLAADDLGQRLVESGTNRTSGINSWAHFFTAAQNAVKRIAVPSGRREVMPFLM